MERVCNELTKSRPTAFAFSLNGRYSALGHENGSLVLLKTESLHEVIKMDLQKPISCLSWHF